MKNSNAPLRVWKYRVWTKEEFSKERKISLWSRTKWCLKDIQEITFKESLICASGLHESGPVMRGMWQDGENWDEKKILNAKPLQEESARFSRKMKEHINNSKGYPIKASEKLKGSDDVSILVFSKLSL